MRDELDIRSSYDVVAKEYASRIYGELAHKPLDRELLNRFAKNVQSLGPICDLGCGPGHVARHLHDHGVPEVRGVDVSLEMVRISQRLNPNITFQTGDMRSLDVADASWGGIVAFYSLIHIPLVELRTVFQELKRVLRPGGGLLVAFHIGDSTLHLDEWWGHRVSVDFNFFQTEEVASVMRSAGLVVEEAIEREPYAEVEHQSRRAYIFARKPETQ